MAVIHFMRRRPRLHRVGLTGCGQEITDGTGFVASGSSAPRDDCTCFILKATCPTCLAALGYEAVTTIKRKEA